MKNFHAATLARRLLPSKQLLPRKATMAETFKMMLQRRVLFGNCGSNSQTLLRSTVRSQIHRDALLPICAEGTRKTLHHSCSARTSYAALQRGD